MYKLIKPSIASIEAGFTGSRTVLQTTDNAFIPFCPDNTDYQQFLRDVEAGAELLDAEGNVMNTEQKQTFLKTIL